MFNNDIVTFPLVSWVRCVALLYLSLILARFLSLNDLGLLKLYSVYWLDFLVELETEPVVYNLASI